MPEAAAALNHEEGRTLLQRIILNAPAPVASLYRRRNTATATPHLSDEETLDLDTYFNSFDEMFWRCHCEVGDLEGEIDIAGPAAIELWRGTPDGRRELVAETSNEALETTRIRLAVPAPAHPRGAGRLALQVKALGPDVRIEGGAWTGSRPPQPIGLAVIVTTFNRPVPLAALLARIAGDPVAAGALCAVVVVNNGASLPAEIIPKELDSVLHFVEQTNSGGAGGFSRGLLEARDMHARGGHGTITHAVLMDDDVQIEPDILLRTARIFALAKGTFLLGGHMLDLFRPTFLYEAGATINEDRLEIRPNLKDLDLAEARSLDAFLDPPPMHYGGWWYLGLPLHLLDEHGWPMPCFIRGDDIEFGVRLTQAGIDTVSVPGVGIWHEPFTAKLGSWHLYYEVRNMMALACWHRPVGPMRLAELIGRWLVADLLTFRYQRAALILRAVADFLEGPAIYEGDPLPVHASLHNLRATYAQLQVPRSRPLQARAPARGPRTRSGLILGVIWAFAAEWIRPDRKRARSVRIAPHDHLWFRVRGIDGVAVSEPWETGNPFYARSRATFRTLAADGATLGFRLVRGMPEVSARWRMALPRMTTEQAWRCRLGVSAAVIEVCREEDRVKL